jgi:hypothetical protein
LLTERYSWAGAEEAVDRNSFAHVLQRQSTGGIMLQKADGADDESDILRRRTFAIGDGGSTGSTPAADTAANAI